MKCKERERLLAAIEKATDDLVAADKACKSADPDHWPEAHGQLVAAGHKLTEVRTELWQHSTLKHPNCK